MPNEEVNKIKSVINQLKLQKVVNQIREKLSFLEHENQTLQTIIKNLPQFPKRIEVSNFPRQINVSNLKDLNFPTPVFPKDIRVTNFLDIPFPSLDKLYDPKKPIAVRMSDGNKFIEAVQGFNQGVGQLVSSGGSGAVVSQLQVLNSMIPNIYDYIGVTTPSNSSEIYTFRTGGSSGSVVSVITIIYTDSTKVTLLSLAKA